MQKIFAIRHYCDAFKRGAFDAANNMVTNHVAIDSVVTENLHRCALPMANLFERNWITCGPSSSTIFLQFQREKKRWFPKKSGRDFPHDNSSFAIVWIFFFSKLLSLPFKSIIFPRCILCWSSARQTVCDNVCKCQLASARNLFNVLWRWFGRCSAVSTIKVAARPGDVCHFPSAQHFVAAPKRAHRKFLIVSSLFCARTCEDAAQNDESFLVIIWNRQIGAWLSSPPTEIKTNALRTQII